MPLQPREGAIAFCSDGYLGIISNDDRQNITFPDGSRGLAYVGYHLGHHKNGTSDKKLGDPWVSRNPTILGYVGNMADSFKLFYAGKPKADYRDELKDLLDIKSGLSTWAVDFLDSIGDQIKQKGSLSKAQIEKIRELWDQHCK